MLSFSSNDYLGLASHPGVIAAAQETARREGFGAGAARLISGNLPAHRALEADLAAFLGRPAALLFASGYQTNLGVVTALAGPQDLVVSDAANHASLIDGCRLSRATVSVFAHADPDAAAAALARPGFRRRLLVTESLFSMDGDAAPLEALAEVAASHDAVLIVDEAHALGTLGPGGRGLCAASGVEPDVIVGTLGKAFGSAGGFATGSETLRSYLLNKARSFVFATAPPPPVAGAALAALRIVEGAEGDLRRSRLFANRAWLVDRLGTLGLAGMPCGPGAILPVILGSDADALAAATHLRQHGLFVAAIRPPTVPEGTARLRVTLSSDHTEEDLELLAVALAGIPR